MAFLTINGWEIPVAEVTKSTEYLGTYKRVFNGSLRDSTSAVKRKWNITTTPLTYDDAYTLRNILISNGDHFGFDNIAGNTGWDNTIGNFIVSDKGVVATDGVATWRPTEGPSLTNAIALEKGTTNLIYTNMSADSASFEGGYGNWTMLYSGLSLSNPTSGGYHLSHYMKLAYSSINSGWSITSPAIPVTAGQSYTFSWYDFHNWDLSNLTLVWPYTTIMVFYQSDKSTVTGSYELSNLGTANINWHRHSITATAPTNSAYVVLKIGWQAPAFPSNGYYGIDAIQFENNAFATSFAYPTRNSFVYVTPSPFSAFNSRELSVFFRIYPFEITGFAATLQFVNNTYTSYSLAIGIDSSNIRIYLVDLNEVTHPYSTSSAFSQGWAYYGAVFSSSQGKLNIYKNGIKVYSTSVNYELNRNYLNFLRVGHFNGSFLLSDLLVLPFAASDSFATAYTSTNTYYKMPYVIISGDIVNNQQIMCFPEVQDADYLQFSNNGTWTTGQKVKFSLLEV